MSGKPIRFKKYRERLKDKIGLEAFNKRYKEYQLNYRKKKKKKYFVYKAQAINGHHKHEDNINSKLLAECLFWIWYKQRGKCALTGVKLSADETTHLDHIIPRCNGGSNLPHNLQFVSAAVNKAKHGLTQNEFIALCQSVVNHTAKQ